MPLDNYSLCPGDTGKKIKFCCPDLLGELQKIDRMVEGEQYLGCLQHIEQLQQKHPDRACLLAIRTMLFRAMGRLEEARATAAMFLEKHPNNTTALAEAAMLTAAEQGGSAAMGMLQRALVVSDGRITARLYEAIGLVAEVLLDEGQWPAGRALLQLQLAVAQDDKRPASMLIGFMRSPDIPLLLKDETSLPAAPDDVPWKTRFEEAVAQIETGNWQAAAERLTALADEVSDSPVIWRSLAMLRGWLADSAGCKEALRQFASLDVPWEDAVEAEALAMLLCDDPLGDRLDVMNLLWTVKDFGQLQAALTLESRAVQLPLDLSSFGSEDDPPPKAAYLLLNRPIAERAEDVTVDTFSRFLGQAMIYGRQTDREARLEVISVVSTDVEQVKTMLAEMAGDALEADAQEEVMGEVPASHELLRRKWRLPDDATPQQLTSLAAEHRRDALLNRWPDLKLGIFEGRSPREVAGDEAYRIRLLAAVLLLEMWSEANLGKFDFNQLRNQLELPTLEPIDPQQTPVESVPLVRLSRVMVERASDDALREGYQRAEMFRAAKALRKFSQAVIDRADHTDSVLASSEEQLRAYSTLARMEEDSTRALEYIERGRTACHRRGVEHAPPMGGPTDRSCAGWDLLELKIRFARREGAEASRLVGHLQSQHMREPGIAEALRHLLVQIGLLRPDGTPAVPPSQAEASMAAAEAAPEAGKIWTPGSQEPGGEKKLWTPD